MPSHLIHKAFCEVIFEKLGIDKKYLEWSIVPDIDIIGLHRIKYHSLLNIDKLYEKVVEKIKIHYKDKNAVIYAVISHVYLDQFTAPVFWQGFYPPAIASSMLGYVLKNLDITLIKGYISLQKNIKSFNSDIFEILKLYDKYLTFKLFGNISKRDLNEKVDIFKNEIDSKFRISEDKILSFMITSLSLHTPIITRVNKVISKINEFLGKNVKFKYYYDTKTDESIKVALNKIID